MSKQLVEAGGNQGAERIQFIFRRTNGVYLGNGNNCLIDERENDGDAKNREKGREHSVKLSVCAVGKDDASALTEQLVENKIQRGRAQARYDGKEHRLRSHRVGAESRKIGARQNKEGQQRRDRSAAVDDLRIGFGLHIRPTDGKGHIDGQNAERRGF